MHAFVHVNSHVQRWLLCVSLCRVVDSPEVLSVIEGLKDVHPFLHALYGCKYKEFFKVRALGGAAKGGAGRGPPLVAGRSMRSCMASVQERPRCMRSCVHAFGTPDHRADACSCRALPWRRSRPSWQGDASCSITGSQHPPSVPCCAVTQRECACVCAPGRRRL